MLLLDEPLGALDLKLRQEMQIELKTIQQEVGITFIYVTHDQEEALAMSDRMAIFDGGLIEQVGTAGRGLRVARRRPSWRASWAPRTSSSGETADGHPGPRRHLHGASREDRPRATPAPRSPTASTSATGTVHDVVYLGSDTRYHVALDAGGELVVIKQNVATSSMEALALKGKAVRLTWHREHTLAVEPTGHPDHRLHVRGNGIVGRTAHGGPKARGRSPASLRAGARA